MENAGAQVKVERMCKEIIRARRKEEEKEKVERTGCTKKQNHEI